MNFFSGLGLSLSYRKRRWGIDVIGYTNVVFECISINANAYALIDNHELEFYPSKP